jgi:hypothetical protein
MRALTAIDVLLDPDESMRAFVADLNGRMLASIPSPPGFALDENHRPHVTVLQRYVRTASLDEVYQAVQEVRATVDLSTLHLTARALTHVLLQPSIGIAVIEVAPGPEVLSLQARFIEALQPYTERGGTAEAFVRTAAEPEIGDETIAFIEDYVPQHSGANYVAHVTVGLAAPEDLAVLEAAPFSPFTFATDALSVYQLGNAGAAARCLHSWRG